MASRSLCFSAAIILALAASIRPVLAAGAFEGGGRQALNITAIVMFFSFVAMRLGITYWAARSTRSAADLALLGFRMDWPSPATADDVISIAAIKIRGARILTSQAFQAVIRPTTPMDASAIKVHQLREQDLARAKPMRKVLPDFLQFIGSRPLVGYWIAFDVRMLNKYLFNMLNIHLPNMRIDVSELYYDREYRNAVSRKCHRLALCVNPKGSWPSLATTA
jgi:hypothetical protein